MAVTAAVDTAVAELSAAKAALAEREIQVTEAETALASTKSLRDTAQKRVDDAEAALYKLV